MIADLPPYPAMKDSGVPWLGSVPQHWELRRTKTVLSQRSEKGYPEEPLLAATQSKRVVRKDEYEARTVLALKDLQLLKLVRIGDFVISLRSFQGGIEFARHQGIISPAYTILYPVDKDHHGYLSYLFKSLPYIESLSFFVTGIRQGKNIDYAKLARSLLPLPPLSEQRVIVRFLHHVDESIHRYIRAKQKLIALLKEQEQAIIQQAVTGQIDVRTGHPHRAYKQSGVDWLDDIPVHWSVARLKFVAEKIVDCLHETPKYSETGAFPAIRTADISPGLVRIESARRIEQQEYIRWTERLEPMPNDILYSREGERFGIAACVPEGGRLCVSQRMMVFRIRPEHNPTFVMWVLNSKQVYAQACQDVMGATAPHVNVSTIRNFVFAVPDRDEQNDVVDLIESSTSGISEAIQSAKLCIEKAREYQLRMVSDVVTGRLDVRGAVFSMSRIPDTDDEIPLLEYGAEVGWSQRGFVSEHVER